MGECGIIQTWLDRELFKDIINLPREHFWRSRARINIHREREPIFEDVLYLKKYKHNSNCNTSTKSHDLFLTGPSCVLYWKKRAEDDCGASVVFSSCGSSFLAFLGAALSLSCAWDVQCQVKNSSRELTSRSENSFVSAISIACLPRHTRSFLCYREWRTCWSITSLGQSLYDEQSVLDHCGTKKCAPP